MKDPTVRRSRRRLHVIIIPTPVGVFDFDFDWGVATVPFHVNLIQYTIHYLILSMLLKFNQFLTLQTLIWLTIMKYQNKSLQMNMSRSFD